MLSCRLAAQRHLVPFGFYTLPRKFSVEVSFPAIPRLSALLNFCRDLPKQMLTRKILDPAGVATPVQCPPDPELPYMCQSDTQFREAGSLLIALIAAFAFKCQLATLFSDFNELFLRLQTK